MFQTAGNVTRIREKSAKCNGKSYLKISEKENNKTGITAAIVIFEALVKLVLSVNLWI